MPTAAWRGGYKPDGIWVTDKYNEETAEDSETTDYLHITYDTLVANKADLLEAAKEWAADNSNSYIGQSAANDIVALIIWTANSANEKKTSYEDLYQTLANAQFAVDKQEALDILDGISFSGVSTKEMKKDCAHTVACETYKEHVQKLVEDARKTIDDLENTSNTKIYSSYDDDTTLLGNEEIINKIIGKVDSFEYDGNSAEKWTDEDNAKAWKTKWLVVQKAYKSKAGETTKWVGLSAYELNEDWAEIDTKNKTSIYYNTTKANNYYDATNNNTIGSYLTDNKDADDASSDAKIESLKAQVAAAKAAYLKKNNSTSQKEYADNMQEALNYLIEQEEITETNLTNAVLTGYFPTDPESTASPATNGSGKYGTDAKAAVKYAKELKDEAATLAAETDENGTLIRDKKDVDDLLEAGLIAIYKLGKGDANAEYKGNAKKGEYDAISDVKAAAKSDIEALYVSLDDTKLAYYKQNSISLLNKFYQVYAEDYEDSYGIMGWMIGYYTPEKTELKAAVDKAVASIEAATKHQQVDKALETFKKDYDYTSFKAAVYGDNTKMGVLDKSDSAIEELFYDAKAYAKLLNDKIKKSDDKYIIGAYDGEYKYGDEENPNSNLKLIMLIADLVGEKDARTTADINKLNDEAMQLVKTLPTKKTVDDAKDALDDAMKALPSTIKLADADKIDAACAALEAYFDLTGDYEYKYDELASKIVALVYAENNELDEKYDKLDKNDKAALDALQDEIDAFAEKYGKYLDMAFATGAAVTGLEDGQEDDTSEWANTYLKTFGEVYIEQIITVDNEISNDLDKIRQDDLDDVKAAINKIPAKANITEESKPVIQAARKAYDAYVQKWTSYENQVFTWTAAYDENGGYAADDLASYYQTLTAAEAAAGLNTTSDADLVKELKIVAKSTAKKGSIKVTWKVVEGDASVADGYQVWKSTKHSKGYKKAFTTSKKSYKNTKGLKKGVRYYYKVRAYKVVDGKNVYSDWSNKARRVAK